MDLVLSSVHPYNTTYSTIQGVNHGPPIFIAKSGRFMGKRHVTIEHLVNGFAGSDPFAEIKLHFSLFGNSDEVLVRGRQIQVLDHGWGWKSVKFAAVDGRIYKWKLDGMRDRHANLEVEGRVAAVYDGGSMHLFSANEPPTLRIYPEGLAFVEDIITTLAYIVKRRDVTKAAAAAAAGKAFAVIWRSQCRELLQSYSAARALGSLSNEYIYFATGSRSYSLPKTENNGNSRSRCLNKRDHVKLPARHTWSPTRTHNEPSKEFIAEREQ
ncbi:hypothetical protein BT96DRAFT_1012674 [Gymnopus androsaceus JB14]|uniref:DUF6593 domain-containing protein n=1 Tax=Gymnopus androsaceus JB14 TaxID=1447944 RepID=A0A6A4IMU0_9AGAR|nr:hypothetical protein BT96DRAFT_1012674 [Gymnopus androsaceus JB14]